MPRRSTKPTKTSKSATRSTPIVVGRVRPRPTAVGTGIKPATTKHTATAKGRSSSSPGHLKKAAGVKSARDFAPGRAGVGGRGTKPSPAGGGYGTTDGIPNMFPASSRGGGNQRVIGKGGAASRGGREAGAFDRGNRGFPGRGGGGTGFSDLGKRGKPAGLGGAGSPMPQADLGKRRRRTSGY